jgi:hypothetical protein
MLILTPDGMVWSLTVKLSATETGDLISAIEALNSTAIVISKGFKFYD